MPTNGMIATRFVITGLSAAIAIVLLARGNVVIGLLLLALVVARLVMTFTVLRRMKARRAFRDQRFGRMQPPAG
jgi:hypothetical protein